MVCGQWSIEANESILINISSLTGHVSRVQDDFGDESNYFVARAGTIPFQLQSCNSLDFDDVLFVPVLRNIFLLVSIMEDKGYTIEFKNYKFLIRPMDSRLGFY